MAIWNVVLSLDSNEEYHSGNITTILNEWGIMDIFNCNKATISSNLLWDVPQWILLENASIEKYERWFNPTLDKVLNSVGLKVVKIVDDKWNDIVTLS